MAACAGTAAPTGQPVAGSSGAGVSAGSGGAAGGNGAAGAPTVGAGSGGAVSGGGVSGSGGSGGIGGSGGSTGGPAGADGATGGVAGTGGSTGGAAGKGESGGAAGTGKGGVSGTGGTSTAGVGGGAAGGARAGAGGTGNAGTAGGGGSSNCNLPATVGFQKDVQPFLSATCGGGNGCHVIDSASTVANGGYDHAYDWITAGAHPSSCPSTPTPKRFEVVIAVINAADPASCSKSRIMPPPDETGANLRKPLTTCQVATLQAWLGEPLVTQAHRVDDTDPSGTLPFPMPPFN